MVAECEDGDVNCLTHKTISEKNLLLAVAMVRISTFDESRESWLLPELLNRKGFCADSQTVTCGEFVDISEGSLIGHGLKEKIEEEDDEEEEAVVSQSRLSSTLMGIVRKVNRLHYVEALHSKYAPEPGDVVVGRIVEVGQGRWFLDIGAANVATLQLAAISLPSGEQRRKTEAEQVDMRRFFVEDDLVSTEVQKVGMDGSILLHTRSARYGKLAHGCCVCVPPSLTVRLAQHMVVLANGVHIVMGKNGFLFIGSPPLIGATDTLNFVPQSSGPRYQLVTGKLREQIASVRRAVIWLAVHFLQVSPASIQAVRDAMIEFPNASTDELWKVLLDRRDLHNGAVDW